MPTADLRNLLAVKKIEVDGLVVRTLDVEGLLKTKASGREKDLIDRLFLSKIK